MACLNPVRIVSEGKEMFVPCGRCALCTMRNASDWLIRLNIAFSDGITVFLTLTYNNDNLPVISSSNEKYDIDFIERYNSVPFHKLYCYFATFCYPDLQRYFKRLRKKGYKFSYYGVSEYGPDGFRPHYHILVNFPFLVEQDFPLVQEDTYKAWNNGFSTCEFSTIQRLKYCLFYSKKIQGSEVSDYLDEHPYLLRPFSFMSKGLGKSFAMQNFDFIKSNPFIYDKYGKRLHTPRYFRKKVFELLDADDMIKMRSVYDCSEKIPRAEYHAFLDWLKHRGKNSVPFEQFYSHPDIVSFYDDYYKGLNYLNEKFKVKLSKKQNSKL